MIHFDSMGLHPSVLEAISELGYKEPTPVQEQSIPLLIQEDTDLVALAQTGTGKTAAFGLPLITRIDTSNRNTQALILSPTRELALQISKELKGFSKYIKGLNIATVYGGASIEGQRKELRSGAQIIVATPGRLLDMINRRYVQLQQTEFVILDEADEMLNMGFLDDIESILSETPEDKLTWLFSATMPADVLRISKRFMTDPKEITVGTKNQGAVNIDHNYYIVNGRQRYEGLKRILDFYPEIFGIVFSKTRRETQNIAEKLINDGYNANALHGELSQAQRDAVMKSFRNRHLQILVATDVAARGIDVDDVTHVIHYNLPDDIENFTHRSGRTARAGKKGTSIALVTKSEARKIGQIERLIKSNIEQKEFPSGFEVCEVQLNHWANEIMESEVKDEDIGEYISPVIEKLNELSKEELIRRVAWTELDHLIKYYRNNVNLNDISDRDRGNFGNEVRFFINLGQKDGLQWQDLKDFVKEVADLGRNDVAHAESKGSFGFFSVKGDLAEKVQEAFEGVTFEGRRVSIEVANKSGGGGGRGRSKGGKRDFGGKRDRRDGGGFDGGRSGRGDNKKYQQGGFAGGGKRRSKGNDFDGGFKKGKKKRR